MSSNKFPHTAKLERYMQSHIARFSGLQSVEKFPNGQSNPTYLISADSDRYVLRMQPDGELLKSAHAVDREFKVMQALQNTAVPVPEVLHLCLDKSVIGTLFFIMRYVDGRVLWDPELPGMTPQHRTHLYLNMNKVLADLHSVDIAAVGLGDFGKPGNYYQRQIDRWTSQYEQTKTASIPAMEALMLWLNDHVPADDGQISLIHGDFRLDNLMFAHDGVAVTGVLDWELSTLGHPFADLAYQCMQWRLDHSAVVRGLAQTDRKALGIPTEEEYVKRYCESRGINVIPDWPFYLGFSFFRFAAIVQGVFKRSLDGNASSTKAKAYGELTPVLSRLGLNVVEGRSSG